MIYIAFELASRLDASFEVIDVEGEKIKIAVETPQVSISREGIVLEGVARQGL